jgi:hypothetical protein
MEERTVFISSCSRRELARRSPGRTLAPMQLLLLAVLIGIVLAGFIAAHGGL